MHYGSSFIESVARMSAAKSGAPLGEICPAFRLRSCGLRRADESISSSGASKNSAHLVEVEARQPLESFRRVAAAEIAQEVRLDAAVGKEGGVDLGVVEPRHRAAVEADGARRHDEIGALQAAVAQRVDRSV